MTVTETCYSQEADKTFIMDVTYDLNENPLTEKVVGWYWGKPNEEDTIRFRGKPEAIYTKEE